MPPDGLRDRRVGEGLPEGRQRLVQRFGGRRVSLSSREERQVVERWGRKHVASERKKRTGRDVAIDAERIFRCFFYSLVRVSSESIREERNRHWVAQFTEFFRGFASHFGIVTIQKLID